MKKILLLMLIGVITCSSIATAQDAVSTPTVSRRVITGQQTAPQLTDGQQLAPLDSNYAITLQGEIAKGQSVDVTLRGVGPKYMAVLVDPTLTVEVIAAKLEQGYSLTYSIGASIPVKTDGNSYQYRNSSITGKILLNLDEPVAIMTQGKEQLTLSISKVAPKK